MMIGTGIAITHPMTRTFLLPHSSDHLPANIFRIALTNPKLIMKERISVEEATWNTSVAITGKMFLSRPTVNPTKNVRRLSRKNWRRFGRIPYATGTFPTVAFKMTVR